MAKDNNSTATPRLRFPEFRKAEGWEKAELGSIATILKGKGVAKSDVVVDGKRPCIRYGELYTRYGEVIDAVHSKTNVPASDLFLSRKNDVIIPASGETKLDIAKASCVLHDDVALGSDLNVLRTNHNGVFLSYLLNGEKRHEVARVAQGHTVVHLYPSQLQEITVETPSLAEQQKIAECLTSLDEVVAAQARKVEALKDYKRGLMQQLFPREGKPLPGLRFPEFHDGPGWESRLLGDFISERCEIADGTAPLFSLTIEDGVTAKTDRYERSFLVTSKEDAYKLALPNDFAFNPMNLRFGAIGRHSGSQPVALSKYYNIFSCDDSVDPRFCELYFRSEEMVAFYDVMATGSLIEKRRVHFDRFLKFDVPFPSRKEQQRIADCLFSVHAQIAASSEKLEALKAHKKGLMQQLFPSPKVD